MGTGLRFEWDPRKAAANLRKHGISFEEARTVFGDPLAAYVHDDTHSTTDEERGIAIGRSAGDRLLKVAYHDKGETVRIISARPLTARETLDYEEGDEITGD